MKRTLAIAFAAVCVMSASVASAEKLTFNTDSVLVTSSNESAGNNNILTTCPNWEAANTGWNTNLRYDDSAWSNTVRTQGDSCLFTWDDTDYPTAFFRYEFDIAGTPLSSRFELWVDDDALVWINGRQVLTDTNGVATYKLKTDWTQYLTEGTNLIAAKVQDTGGQQHLTIAAGIDFEPVPEPGCIALISAALAGFCIWRR